MARPRILRSAADFNTIELACAATSQNTLLFRHAPIACAHCLRGKAGPTSLGRLMARSSSASFKGLEFEKLHRRYGQAELQAIGRTVVSNDRVAPRDIVEVSPALRGRSARSVKVVVHFTTQKITGLRSNVRAYLSHQCAQLSRFIAQLTQCDAGCGCSLAIWIPRQ